MTDHIADTRLIGDTPDTQDTISTTARILRQRHRDREIRRGRKRCQPWRAVVIRVVVWSVGLLGRATVGVASAVCFKRKQVIATDSTLDSDIDCDTIQRTVLVVAPKLYA